ncbi:MAG: hypothetical protein NT004_05440 [Bacteroidetes bacterium]|nr:hypothetical protein [Bacteroidota bacterium]
MKTKMKMMAGTIGMIILSLCGIFLFSAFRSTSENGKAKLVMNIRAYLDKNVKPIMQPQRVKLDQILTAEEKIQVSILNNRMQQLIKQRHECGIGFTDSDEFSFARITVFTEKQKSEQKRSRDEMRWIMAQAWAIADRHEKEINQLLNEKLSFFGTWQRGITSIVTDYLDDKFYFIGSKQIIKRIENREIVKYYSPVAFLLWDPQQRFIPDELLGK